MKASYSNMKLKIKNEVKTFDFCGQKIEVTQYLPAQDKYDLIMLTLQKSREGNIYNEFKLNLYFELGLVYMYTNMSFTDKQREDEFKLYDTLKTNGFFELFYEELNETEFNDLFDQICEIKLTLEKDNLSVAGMISNLITNLPEKAEAAVEIVNSFDPAKFKEVIDFARYANGGRDINTNQPVNIETPLSKFTKE